MGTQNNNIDPTSTHHMPSRRERLRAFMRLKSQRRYLIGGVAALGLSTAVFAGAFANESASPDVVKLGTGKASIEAEPLAAYEAAPVADPVPSPSTSPIGAGEASYYGKELAGNRVIDLSTAAARSIGLIRSGTGRVSLALLVN